jgi:threonine aldolase
MNFASDNTAGIAPVILDAITRANDGDAPGYGADALTAAVEQRIREICEHEVAVFLVPTGTAANAIALAQLSPPWGAVLCHAESHIVTDECGAPEFFGAGLKLRELAGVGCKIAVEALQAALDRHDWGGPHHLTPSVLSLTQATEAGTVYAVAEIAALARVARPRGMTVHMDGARLANALVHLGASLAQATWQAGVDVLSFGATKGGAMGAEAIVFFDPALARGMAERRKRGGHLLSKHRFVAAQFEAFLRHGYWLDLARHANAMAGRLAEQLAAAGLAPVWPVEANLIFLRLPKTMEAPLRAAGASFYARHSDSLPVGMTVAPEQMLVRLVTSFATSEDEIERFVTLVRALWHQLNRSDRLTF